MNETTHPDGGTPGTAGTVEVTLGEHTVRVPAGGLYDRYRMRTDLDEVAKDPRVPGVDFFRVQPKTRVDSHIGETWTPNFYYAMSSARLVMASPTAAVRDRLPEGLEPLEIAPGVSLSAIMLFRYDVADVDFYTEATVGIPVRPAVHGPSRAIDLASALASRHFDSYVLSLPVNTEIAQVRGRYGYGLPKWVADIRVAIDEQTAVGRIANDDGGLDLELRAATPRQTSHASGSMLSSVTSYTSFDGGWHQTFSQTNALASGTSLMPRGVGLRLGSGRMADDVRSLRPIRPLMLDVMTSGQLALHMPADIVLG